MKVLKSAGWALLACAQIAHASLCLLNPMHMGVSVHLLLWEGDDRCDLVGSCTPALLSTRQLRA